MSDLVKGLYPKEKHEKAPDWVKMKLGIHKEQLMDWLSNAEVNENGFINSEIRVSKTTGKLHVLTEDVKPEKQSNDLPF